MLPIERFNLPPILQSHEQLFVQALKNVQAQLAHGFTTICMGPEQFRISQVYLKGEKSQLRADKSLLNNSPGLYGASIDVVDFPPRSGGRIMSLTHVRLPEKEMYHGTFFTSGLDIVAPKMTTEEICRFLTDIKNANFDEPTSREKFNEAQNNPEFTEVFWTSSQPTTQSPAALS